MVMSVWDFFVWFFWFYILITCIWIFITVIIDIFRDPTLSGGAKALWIIFLVILPFLAAFIYLIARGQEHGDPPHEGVRGRAGGERQLHPHGGRIAGEFAQRGDRVGEEPARLGSDHAGRVRRPQGEGARLRVDPSGQASIRGLPRHNVSD